MKAFEKAFERPFFKTTLYAAAITGMAAGVFAQEKSIIIPPPPRPIPPPIFRPVDLRADEKPVEVAPTNDVVADNGLVRRVRTTITFTNPNPRDFSGDLEFPVPDGATVCGYALEIDGAMVPGVVTEKEKARVAFESEKAKRVDPGIVEHVKGNIWKTRIFPLRPKTPRKASVDYIEPIAEGDALTLCEKDGDDIFVGERGSAGKAAETIADKIAAFSVGTILWDASGSAEPFAAVWCKKLDSLPENGKWTLVVFRNGPLPDEVIHSRAPGLCEAKPDLSKKDLLEQIRSLAYDGGTDLGVAAKCLSSAEFSFPVLLFTDEIDTLGLEAPQYEREGVVIASRDDAPTRAVTMRKLVAGEKPPEGIEVKEGTLLATAWAANRVADLASQAESRKEEFLELGRKYGVASSATSLIVLESLDQYLTHKIEPPKSMSFHDEWVRRRAAEDDQIAKKEADAEHERDLLRLWKERVEWWNNPIPPKRTPKSGLFDGVEHASGEVRMARNASVAAAPNAAPRAAAARISDDAEELAAAEAEEAALQARDAELSRSEPIRALRAYGGVPPARKMARRDTGEAGGGGATITVKPWNPDSPYLKKIADAKEPYAEYLAQRKENGSSPAFFMDCASWFFKKGDATLGWRILSNMAEFKLEDAAVWRSMGWCLREAGLYDEAVLCFRHALRLRGEEGQSRRDLALVLAERAKSAIAGGNFKKLKGKLLKEGQKTVGPDLKINVDGSMNSIVGEAKKDLAEAMALLREAAFTNFARRSGRRSNDRQVSIVALEELNALIAWCEAVKWPDGQKPAYPELDSAYRRDLPVKIRIVLSWNADETDIDLHVLEPEGEEAFYSHRRTDAGGFVSEDVTTGYGPEEYLRKEGKGIFKILTNYFASHQTALTGPATVTATVYTDWATSAEKREVLTLRLEKQKDKHLVGEVNIQ